MMNSTTALLIILVCFFASMDYGFKEQTTNTEAIVAYKKLASPGEAGETPYVLILTRGDQAWTFRVSAEFYKSVDVEDRLMLTASRGYITGIIYHISFDEGEYA